jgi:cystathionine beta-synthase
VESIGHFLHPETDPDIWPESFHPGVVDRFERVSDRESLTTVRRLAADDGLLAGPSSGTAVAAALRVARPLGPSDLVVVLLPDSGRSYLSKVFSDGWMRGWGFLEDPLDGAPTVADVLAAQGNGAPLVTVDATATVIQALGAVASDTAPAAALIVAPRPSRPYGVSAAEVTGSFAPARLAAALAGGRARGDDPVTRYADAAPPAVGTGQSLDDALAALDGASDKPDTVLVLRDGRACALLTRAALLAEAEAGRPRP